MMKARSYNRRFLTLGIEPNLCAIQESNGIQYDKDMGDFLLSENIGKLCSICYILLWTLRVWFNT